jgi:hypothetical protein
MAKQYKLRQVSHAKRMEGKQDKTSPGKGREGKGREGKLTMKRGREEGKKRSSGGRACKQAK